MKPSPAASSPSARLAALLELRPGEGRALALSTVFMFCVLASFYMLRPVRDQLGAHNADDLSKFYLTTLLGTLLLQPLFGTLVARTPRRVFVPVAYGFFGALMLVFAQIFAHLEGPAPYALAWVFFSWHAVFNVFAVALFWSVMADVFDHEQSKRLFAHIGLGGTLGAMCGARLTSWLAGSHGTTSILLCSFALLGLATLCAQLLGSASTARGSSPSTRSTAPVGEPDPKLGGSAMAGMLGTLRSPFLLVICGYLFFQTVLQTFSYFQQSTLVREAQLTEVQSQQLFAGIDFWANAITFLLQLFLTTKLLRWLGLGWTLAILPLVCLAGFSWLGAEPTLAVAVGLNVAYRGMSHGLARPARETLFTVIPREMKYKAKSFIDTFVYRGGDQLGAWGFDGLKRIGLTQGGLALCALPLCGLWLAASFLCARKAKREFAANAAAKATEPH